MTGQTFQGGVFHAALEGGREGASLFLRSGTLVAALSGDRELELPLAGASVEIGGASGRMVFVRNPDRSMTMFSEAPGFYAALETAPELAPALARTRETMKAASTTRTKWWLGGLAFVGLLVAAGPWAFDTAVRGTVSALPFSVDEKIGAIGWASIGAKVVDNPKATKAAESMIEILEPHARIGTDRVDVEDAKKAKDGSPKFRIAIIDDGTPNAFALPGGQMALQTGLIRLAETPEEIMGVLAHEMAHVTKRHSLRAIASSLGVFGGIQLLLGDVSVLVTLAAQLATLGYSREQEAEADAEGVRMLLAAGINPEGLAVFFEKMAKKMEEMPDIPEWLSTHPDLKARANEVRALAEKLGAPKTFEPVKVDFAALKAAGRLAGDEGAEGTKTSSAAAGAP